MNPDFSSTTGPHDKTAQSVVRSTSGRSDGGRDALGTHMTPGATDKRPDWETALSQSESLPDYYQGEACPCAAHSEFGTCSHVQYLPDQVPLRFVTNALRRAFIRGTEEQAAYVRVVAQEIADECGIPRDKMRNLIVDARIHDLRSEFEDLDFMNQFSQDFDDAS